ncbi:MAG: hypothetical protein ACYDDF_03935 [Thermoplasmatota archaeon]
MPLPDDDEDAPAMTTRDALVRIATTTEHVQGLRIRTEGLTLFIFSVCVLASYLTITAPLIYAFSPGKNLIFISNGQGNFSSGGHSIPFALQVMAVYGPLLWYVIAVAGIIGVWRGAALSFHTGISTPRLLTVFVGWLVAFAIFTVLAVYVDASNPRPWHLDAWTLILGLFAILNPLRFTSQGRAVAAGMTGVALITALYASLNDFPGVVVGFLAGGAVGIPGLIGGLWLIYGG